MMKKILLSLGLIGIFGWFIAFTFAHNNTDYKSVEFSNGVTAQINIENVGTDRRSLSTSLDIWLTSNLKCDIMTPNSNLVSISSCNGEFWYDGNKAGRIKVWVRHNNETPITWEDKPNNDNEWTYPQWIYDFDNGGRIDDNLSDSSNNNGDNFYLTASPTDPNQDEAVDITVKSRDSTSTNTSYRGSVRFKVEKKSGSSDRSTASSSLYHLSRTSYTFTSSDHGIHSFTDLVTFYDDNYDYRLVAYDNNDSSIEGTKIFYLNGNSSTYNADNFYITASPSSPNQDEATDITIKARDNTTTDQEYRGSIKFKVEKKSGSNSRSTASSSLYDLSRTSYTFTSSDNGEHTFSNLVTFYDDSYDYRLVVYDDNNTIESTKTFTLNGGSNNTNYNTDNFYISTDDTTPNQNQLVNLTIKARNNTSTDSTYRGNIKFEVRYRTSGSTNWTKTTSLSYYEMKYPYETNGYTFNSSNNGLITITDFIRFRKTDYEYKVIVMDSDYNEIKGEKIFTVGTVDTTTSDNFYVTTDDTTPSTLQRVDLTVKSRNGTSTDNTYRGTVQFEIYKKASTASTWTLTTSSTDYEMKSTYTNGYTFTSSNAGQKTFTDLIRFKRTNYSYKVLAYDEADENIVGEKIFTVGTVSNTNTSSVDGFTSSQLNTVQSLYSARNTMISNMENTYPLLRSNTRRQTMSDDLKSAMQEIIDNDNNKTYNNFTDFYAAFLDRYRYTISVR